MSDQPYYWDKFRLEIFIISEPSRVFKSWASVSGIQSWFRNHVLVKRNDVALSSTNEIFKPGDKMLWADFEGQELCPSDILEVQENVLLKQTFDSKKIILLNRFKEVKGGTLLELTQSEMPVDPNSMAAWHLSCFAGWTFRLANLKSVLEKKIDIRENDANLIFQPAKYIYDESWKRN